MPVIRNIDKNAILNAVADNDDFGRYAAECWRQRVEPYIPYNTGRLCHDVTIEPYKIQYNAPYADTVYNDLKRNFRKDKHPLATAKWNEVAEPAIIDYFVQDLQEYIDRKGLNV